jgi:hypothetical protein
MTTDEILLHFHEAYKAIRAYRTLPPFKGAELEP